MIDLRYLSCQRVTAGYEITDEGGFYVATTRTEEIAKLFMGAQELFDALESLLDWFNVGCGDQNLLHQCRENGWAAIDTVKEVSKPSVTALENKIKDLEKRIERYEQLRPHWAMGYSSDSLAAQVNIAAMHELWKLLGVENQTEAVMKLKELGVKCAGK